MELPTRDEIQEVLAKGREARNWTDYWAAIDRAVALTLLITDADPEDLADQFDIALGHKLKEGYGTK